MKKLLKILNPIIFVLNLICWSAHVQTYSRIKKICDETGQKFEYQPYDYSKDIQYF
jgi:hypothetical protein